MVHCGEKWVNMFEKHPEICPESDVYRRRIERWIHTCDGIISRGFERNVVFKKFPEGAHRELPLEDDPLYEQAINYVCKCLKRDEKVTGSDLKKTISAWRNDENCTSCSGVKCDPIGSRSSPDNGVKPPSASIAQTLKQKYGGQEHTPPPSPEAQVRQQEIVEAGKSQQVAIREPVYPDDRPVEEMDAAPPKPPRPAPCNENPLFPCPDGINHIDTKNTILGPRCNMVGLPLNQLPGDECPLERKARLKGTPPEPLKPASQLQHDGLGNTFTKPPPIVIKKTLLQDSERDAMVDALLERTRFTPNDLELIDDLLKTKKWGWTCRFDLVEAAVLNFIAQSGGA